MLVYCLNINGVSLTVNNALLDLFLHACKQMFKCIMIKIYIHCYTSVNLTAHKYVYFLNIFYKTHMGV